MKQSALCVAFIFFLCTGALAGDISPRQDKNGLQFKVGSSFTYIWNSDSPYHFYRESTWNTNVAFSYFNRLWLGVQVLPTFTRQYSGGITTRRNYMISGLYLQYELFQRDRLKFYFEFSLNTGDFCSCGLNDPYRQGGLLYWGGGGGFEFPIKRITEKVSFEFAFFNYVILNELPGIHKYNHTQYILGLNYTFGDPR